jgi:hypothetical protein
MSEEHIMAACKSMPGLNRRVLLTSPPGSARRPCAIAVLAAAAAVGLSACSGAANSPQVAHLGGSSSSTNGGGTTAATANSSTPRGNPTQLLNEWATCIRGHGDPNQTDPTIDANRDIDISMTDVSTTLAGEVHGSTGPCSNYLLGAEAALRGDQPAPSDNPVKDVKFAECMRANGVPDFPDPNGTGSTYVENLDPNGPTFQNATKLCDKQIGQSYYAPGKEAPGVVIVTSCNAPPGKQCPSGSPGGGGVRPVPASSGNGE